MDHQPESPFDFRGLTSLKEVFNVASVDVFNKLQASGLRLDAIQDLFFDALEAEGVDPSLKRQVADAYEPQLTELATAVIEQFIERGGMAAIYSDPFRSMERTMLDGAQNLSQEAIRIVKIKGEKAVHPLVREIAREVSAVPAEKHESCGAMMDAMVAAYYKSKEPPKPRKGKHFRI